MGTVTRGEAANPLPVDELLRENVPSCLSPRRSMPRGQSRAHVGCWIWSGSASHRALWTYSRKGLLEASAAMRQQPERRSVGRFDVNDDVHERGASVGCHCRMACEGDAALR